jgi:hypothetical protein
VGAPTPPRSGGRILIDQLALHGTDVIFGVPGESYLAALDALHDSPIRFVNARHEAGAANMAEADAKLTGRPGVCFVTRGPGATHGSIGVHTAFADSTPHGGARARARARARLRAQHAARAAHGRRGDLPERDDLIDPRRPRRGAGSRLGGLSGYMAERVVRLHG